MKSYWKNKAKFIGSKESTRTSLPNISASANKQMAMRFVSPTLLVEVTDERRPRRKRRSSASTRPSMLRRYLWMSMRKKSTTYSQSAVSLPKK